MAAQDRGGDHEVARDVWRALASPHRRRLLDALAAGPQTTSQLAALTPDLSRFAVMQHLGVLVDSGLVLVRRRGRFRFNHLNPAPLREWYERWVTPFADRTSAEALALRRHIESQHEGAPMSTAVDQFRTVRIETELRFRAPAERVFSALTERIAEWFPFSYGEKRVRAIVVEPRVGGAHYEDWGDGRGHLYGVVTVYDPPRALSLRGRIMPGTILDTRYDLATVGDETILRMSKVAVGPMTDDEAASVTTHGDISRYADALRAVVER